MKRVAPLFLALLTSSVWAAADDGRQLFLDRCGYCHLAHGTGTMMLDRRLGPDRALLAERDDIPTPYVKHVVRNGLQSMPALTRVEVPDGELEAIANWIARDHGGGPE